MSELPELRDLVASAASRIEVPWSRARKEAVLSGVYRKKRRRRALRLGAGVAALLVVALLAPRLVGSLLPRRELAKQGAGTPAQNGSVSGGTSLPAQSPGLAPGELLRFGDGSMAQAQGGRSRLVVREQRPGRTVVELQGSASFAVTPNPQRLFRVEAGGVAVEVLGTRFTVEQIGERVRVAVQEGRVRVLWAAHYAEVAAGQSALFPAEAAEKDNRAPLMSSLPVETAAMSAPSAPAQAEPAVPGPVGTTAAGIASVATGERPAPPVVDPTRERAAIQRRPLGHGAVVAAEPSVAGPLFAELPTPVAPTPAWKARASEGDFAAAYRLAYEPGTGETPRHEALAPGDLLLLADVARLSRHPADAVPPLARLLREHTRDPRAPLAAFTLGRVQLDELGRPREAAESFRRAEDLDPDGPLAQDALAREVEAWSRAGETGRARERASAYVQRYPSGRRLRSVRQYGALD
jgi:transmembrane sensor